jgi:hypothetical protein
MNLKSELSRLFDVKRTLWALIAILLTAPVARAVEPPPQCPKGSGPLRVDARIPSDPLRLRWQCEPNIFWPSGNDLQESDCPTGTHFETIPQSATCIPPQPDCGMRAGALLDPTSASGWRCLRKPACPPGSSAEFSPKGWGCVGEDVSLCFAIKDQANCDRNQKCKWTPPTKLPFVFGKPAEFPAGCFARESCPAGTTYQGENGGGCAPSDEVSCKSLAGWEWTPKRWLPGDPKYHVSGEWLPASCVLRSAQQ